MVAIGVTKHMLVSSNPLVELSLVCVTISEALVTVPRRLLNTRQLVLHIHCMHARKSNPIDDERHKN